MGDVTSEKWTNGWEIRRYAGELDEVVGQGFFHLEQMSDTHWWMALYDTHGNEIAINLTTTRATIRGHAELECDLTKPLKKDAKLAASGS